MQGSGWQDFGVRFANQEQVLLKNVKRFQRERFPRLTDFVSLDSGLDSNQEEKRVHLGAVLLLAWRVCFSSASTSLLLSSLELSDTNIYGP